MVKGSLVLAVLLSASALACTVGAPSGQDLFSPATPAPSPTSISDPPCDEAGCAANELAYRTITECTTSSAERCRLVSSSCGGSSYYCGSAPAQCRAIPTCQADEIEVATCSRGASCTVRSMCGTSILCQEIASCDAYPSCDPGDLETKDLAECKEANVDCYQRTVCGSTITCMNVK